MNVIHFGDGIEGMAGLADASVDHVITDPPYSQHVHGNSMGGVNRHDGEAYGEARDLGFDSITEEMAQRAAVQFARIVRRWVLVFTDVEGVALWKACLEGAGLEYIRCGAWIKRDAAPQFTGDRPAAGFEAIVIAHPKGKKRWNGGGRHAVWATNIVRGEERTEHTTQKPQELMEALVRDFTDTGDVICDPFAGSGTTISAAKRLGRSAFGWEIQEHYARIANARVRETQEQLSLLEETA